MPEKVAEAVLAMYVKMLRSGHQELIKVIMPVRVEDEGMTRQWDNGWVTSVLLGH